MSPLIAADYRELACAEPLTIVSFVNARAGQSNLNLGMKSLAGCATDGQHDSQLDGHQSATVRSRFRIENAQNRSISGRKVSEFGTVRRRAQAIHVIWPMTSPRLARRRR
jgi:hypothetical protein